jgi:hypothetical protein
VNLSSRTAASLYQQVLFTDAMPECGGWGYATPIKQALQNCGSSLREPRANLELAVYSVCSAQASYSECFNIFISWIWVHIVSFARNSNFCVALLNKRDAFHSLFTFFYLL